MYIYIYIVLYTWYLHVYMYSIYLSTDQAAAIQLNRSRRLYAHTRTHTRKCTITHTHVYTYTCIHIYIYIIYVHDRTRRRAWREIVCHAPHNAHTRFERTAAAVVQSSSRQTAADIQHYSLAGLCSQAVTTIAAKSTGSRDEWARTRARAHTRPVLTAPRKLSWSAHVHTDTRFYHYPCMCMYDVQYKFLGQRTGTEWRKLQKG